MIKCRKKLVYDSVSLCLGHIKIMSRQCSWKRCSYMLRKQLRHVLMGVPARGMEFHHLIYAKHKTYKCRTPTKFGWRHNLIKLFVVFVYFSFPLTLFCYKDQDFSHWQMETCSLRRTMFENLIKILNLSRNSKNQFCTFAEANFWTIRL